MSENAPWPRAPTFADYRVLVENQSIGRRHDLFAPSTCMKKLPRRRCRPANTYWSKSRFTMRVSSGKALCNLAKTKSRILMVEMTHRFLPPLLEAKRFGRQR